MMNGNLMRGLFLMAVALLFGIGAFNYQLGKFSHAGPGLFPLLVSGLLFLLGLLTVVRSRFEQAEPMHFKVRNLAIILGSISGFALLASYVNTALAIIFLVFFASLAGEQPYSVKLNAKVTAGLLLVALALHKLLGLNLPLI